MPIVPITHFKGLHNKGPSLRLPDSDLRRITREDVTHHNEAILP